MDLREAFFGQVISEETANRSLDSEDSVFRGGSKIQNTVVQTSIRVDSDEAIIWLAVSLFWA